MAAGSQAPAEDPWQTALYVAAMEGRLTLARSLLRLGADPDIRDHHFGGTPLGWARYFGQEQLIELLDRSGRTRVRCRGTRPLITRRAGG